LTSTVHIIKRCGNARHRTHWDIAAIVEENSASSEEMSASAIEVSNSINSVTAITKSQGEVAGKLAPERRRPQPRRPIRR